LLDFPSSLGIAGVCATVFHDGAMNPIEGETEVFSSQLRISKISEITSER